MLGDWREEIVSYAITGQDTKKEKTTIKGNFDKDVEVELDKTVYQYSLRLYETPYATNYNFYTLAHDDIYRNSSATDTNCYNQPPHLHPVEVILAIHQQMSHLHDSLDESLLQLILLQHHK